MSPMKRLFVYLTPFYQKLFWASGTSILNKILDLMPPLLVAWIIDTVRGDAPSWISALVGTHDPVNLALFLAVLGFVIFGFESLFQWGYQFGFMTLAQQVQNRLRTHTYSHMQNREIAFFENHRLGDTLSILNDDINQLERFLNNGFNQLIQLGVVFIFSGFVLFSTSWQLATISLITIPLVIWGSLIYQRLISPRYQAIREQVGALNSRIENNISGILVIKSFTAEQFELDRIQKASDAYQDANVHAIKLNSLYVPLIRMVIAAGFASVLFLGSYWILKGYNYLTVGELVLFSMLIQRMLWPLTTLGTTFDDYERAKASAGRVFGLLDSPSLVKDPESPAPVPTPPYRVQFKGVSFKYPIGEPVLTDLNLVIEPGQRIGIAGTTGSGKSTLIKLLLRYYDPTAGEICINEAPLTTLRQNTLRQLMALVSQDVYLFYGTIYENIAYGSKSATPQTVREAAKLAQLNEFIESLPQTYDTVVGERGIKLSGGQRQRLSIARAILKDAPIMIFDEATSAVDTETEKAIKENLDRITEGKTALIIAHRLSTIKSTDRILVLDQGKIAEDGTHDDLIHQGGIYNELWRLQSGGQ